MMPPARVLAAVDFSESSRAALACAARLAHQCNAELHIVHVPHRLLCAAATSRGTPIANEVNEELRAFVRDTDSASDVRLPYHVVCGDAAHVIRDIAHRESCDVVVVGAHGLSGDNMLPFGTTTDALLRTADTPVIVVPDAWTPPSHEGTDLTGLGPVIVGLDFTWPSIDATTAGARLAACLRTRLILVHVVTPVEAPPRWRSDVDTIAREQAEAATACVRPIAAALRSIAPLDVRIEIGDVASNLADLAQGTPGAVLVLGRSLRPRPYGPPGAIASRVLMRAHVPLLLHMSPF